jgi:hypothetical protein
MRSEREQYKTAQPSSAVKVAATLRSITEAIERSGARTGGFTLGAIFNSATRAAQKQQFLLVPTSAMRRSVACY